MSELTDITAIFKKLCDAFLPITAKPRDADMQKLNKSLVVCTLSVTLTGTSAGCTSGVVLLDSIYQTNHGGAFDFMRDARPNYNPSIKILSKDDCLSKMHGM